MVHGDECCEFSEPDKTEIVKPTVTLLSRFIKYDYLMMVSTLLLFK